MTSHLFNQNYHSDVSSKVTFGFWIYILTDAILFSVLFATYAVLHNNTFGDISIKDITYLPYCLLQSIIFLSSSFIYGLGVSAINKHNSMTRIMLSLSLTFLLGLSFVALEFNEFLHIFMAGGTWQTSAFLSSFFTLLGMHWLHVIVGLLWIIILMIQIVTHKLTPTMKTRLRCLGLFWDFLNIVWIFIFTTVYLMGAI